MRCSYCANTDLGDRGLHNCPDSMSDYVYEQWLASLSMPQKKKYHRLKVTAVVEVRSDTYQQAYTAVMDATNLKVDNVIAVEGIGVIER